MANLGENLRAIRKAKGMTQKQLADKSGVKQSSISELETGESQKTGFIVELARALGVTSEQLIAGVSATSNSQNPFSFIPPKDTEIVDISGKGLPVISWVQAGDYTPVASADLSSVIEWLPYDPRAGKNGFCLIVKGVSMEPEFKPDDRIYVNPTFQMDELNTGALVVMACDGDSEATFKELVVEGGKYYLRALNPDWHEKIMPIDHTCRLVGKVVGKYVIYK